MAITSQRTGLVFVLAQRADILLYVAVKEVGKTCLRTMAVGPSKGIWTPGAPLRDGVCAEKGSVRTDLSGRRLGG